MIPISKTISILLCLWICLENLFWYPVPQLISETRCYSANIGIPFVRFSVIPARSFYEQAIRSLDNLISDCQYVIKGYRGISKNLALAWIPSDRYSGYVHDRYLGLFQWAVCLISIRWLTLIYGRFYSPVTAIIRYLFYLSKENILHLSLFHIPCLDISLLSSASP